MEVKKIDTELIKEREKFVYCNGRDKKATMECNQESVSGTVSQRACVYCGARVVLNPITDAYHIVHGPIGCASYTWDIRGSLSSGEEVYRNSFSTDLGEFDVIFGGAKKLTGAIDEIAEKFKPKVIFIYSTCIVGVIGDDVDAVCRLAEEKHNIRVISVKSPGFAGHKSMGYKAACNALIELMGEKKKDEKLHGVNYLGDFNLSGEVWIIKNYLQSIGVNIISTITGDSTSDSLKKSPYAALNIVQCAGSMTYLAKNMEEKYGVPFMKVSFFGIEDTVNSIINTADALGDPEISKRAREFAYMNEKATNIELDYYRKRLKGKKAAIYVGGGFKAISLIKQFRDLGMDTVVVGTQTGKKDEYEVIKSLASEGTIILDDTNPYELEKFMREKEADILVGGVKERPLAYKLGIAFCDHNHERKHPLCGFEGSVNFAKEVDESVSSPVWNIIKSERRRVSNE
jgi:nitrogenase molybdenum-cofactor synthesis protein NifE